jgi:hypothetical protein
LCIAVLKGRRRVGMWVVGSEASGFEKVAVQRWV